MRLRDSVQGKPDPRIKALPGGSSPLWEGGLKSEVMAAGKVLLCGRSVLWDGGAKRVAVAAGRSLSLVYAMSEKGSENTCIIEKIRL